MRGKKKPKTVERKAAATEFQQKTLQGFKANNATAQQRLESNPIQLQLQVEATVQLQSSKMNAS